MQELVLTISFSEKQQISKSEYLST
jgi:hypothetical protein